MNPDYIVEAASPAAMQELVLPALKGGSSVVTLSIGAPADEDFYEEVMRTARDNGTRVYLASGAIGGFDVLRTVSLMETSEARSEERRVGREGRGGGWTAHESERRSERGREAAEDMSDT